MARKLYRTKAPLPYPYLKFTLGSTNSTPSESAYGVPLRSKYPDSEMLFQKQKISPDVQNMIPKIITYRSRPKKKDVHRVPVYLMK